MKVKKLEALYATDSIAASKWKAHLERLEDIMNEKFVDIMEAGYSHIAIVAENRKAHEVRSVD